MLNFNQFINEKFNWDKKDVIDTANAIAKAISKHDHVKAKIHDVEFDEKQGASFEISIDGEKFAGGSFYVKDNGDVVNVAIGNKFPNAVYAKVGDTNIKNIIKNIEMYV